MARGSFCVPRQALGAFGADSYVDQEYMRTTTSDLLNLYRGSGSMVGEGVGSAGAPQGVTYVPKTTTPKTTTPATAKTITASVSDLLSGFQAGMGQIGASGAEVSSSGSMFGGKGLLLLGGVALLAFVAMKRG